MTLKYSNKSLRISQTVSGTSNTLPKILLGLLAFCEKNIVRYGLLVFSMLPKIGFLSKYILFVLYVALIFLCIARKTKIGVTELLVPLFMVSAILLTFVFYPQNTKFITNSNNFWNTIFPCLRWFIVGLIIIPDKYMIDLLGKASCLAIIVETAFLIFYMIPNGLVVSDDMSRAYQLLPNIMLAVNYAFNSKKATAVFFSVVGLLYLLSLGTRGPFFILIIFIVVKFVRTHILSSKRKLLSVLGVCVFGIILSIPKIYISILTVIKNLIGKTGLSTRILDYLIEGTTISETGGRDDLYKIAFELISERPLLGHGVYGEWPVVYWNIHNLYLELWIHFGVILGSLLLIWGISLIAKSYFKTSNSYAKDIILVFASFVFFRGFFGGSYLMFSVFFLLGICIKERRRIRNQL